MDNMPLGVIFFLSVPEEFLITVLGLLLFGIKFRNKLSKLLLAVIIQALISFLIRQLPLPFGVHTIIQIPLFAIPMYFLMKIPYLYSLLCLIVSATIYTVLDATLIPLLLNITGIPLEMILKSTYLRVMFFIPQALTMMLLILIIYYTRFKLFDITYHSLIKGKKNEFN